MGGKQIITTHLITIRHGDEDSVGSAHPAFISFIYLTAPVASFAKPTSSMGPEKPGTQARPIRALHPPTTVIG